jgi:hypothetical protein
MSNGDRDDFAPLDGQPDKRVRVFQMDQGWKPIKRIAEYENEDEAVTKHRPSVARREAVEERKPEGTTYVPIQEWLWSHRRS